MSERYIGHFHSVLKNWGVKDTRNGRYVVTGLRSNSVAFSEAAALNSFEDAQESAATLLNEIVKNPSAGVTAVPPPEDRPDWWLEFWLCGYCEERSNVGPSSVNHRDDCPIARARRLLGIEVQG